MSKPRGKIDGRRLLRTVSVDVHMSHWRRTWLRIRVGGLLIRAGCAVLGAGTACNITTDTEGGA